MPTETQSGIYAIINIQNGHRYIGSAVKLFHRWNQHRHLLRKALHDNRHLQSAWNKYGEYSFQFKIIEECPPEMLLDTEQRLLDELHPEYNIAKMATSSLGIKRTPEARAKMSANHVGMTGMKHTIEARAKMSRAQTGKKASDETRARLSATHRGQLPWNTGKEWSVEHKAILSAAHMGPWSEARRLAFDKKGKPWSEARRLAFNKKGKPWTAARRRAQDAKKEAT